MSFPVFKKNENIDDISYDPNLFDLMMKMKREIMKQINCVKIGSIVKYDQIDNIASVKIMSQLKLINGDIIEYPILEDCPVFYLSGNDSYISMPISEGDECIVLFADRSIDNWHISSQAKTPQDARLHSISDAIVLVGIKSLPNVVNRPIGSLCINGGSTKISLKNDAQNLKTELDSLFDKINDLISVMKDMNTQIAALTVTGVTTGPSVSGIPSNAVNFTVFNTTLDGYITNINDIKSNIDELLDTGSL